jgi:hypothetical protein
LAIAAGVLLSGCATHGPVLSEGVGAMRTSVAGAKAGTTKAFADINAARRDDAIDDILDANMAPSEAAFEPVIDRDTAARWGEAFDRVDDYLGALQDLVDPKRSAETTTNLNAIGTALQSDTIGVKLPHGAAQVFAALGGALVQAAAERKAQAVMLRTDPQFQSLMRRLGDLVAGKGEGTLAAMVKTQWQRRLDGIAADTYGDVRAAGRDERKAVVVEYAAALDARDAQLQTLDGLRSSLFALAEAHGAAARGSDGAVFYWIAQLNQRLKEARDAAGAK